MFFALNASFRFYGGHDITINRMARDELRQLSESLMDKEHIGPKEAMARVEESTKGAKTIKGKKAQMEDAMRKNLKMMDMVSRIFKPDRASRALVGVGWTTQHGH